ncbi:MAG: MBOAT family protein, partial [Planctomycetota bacterium]
HRLDDDLRLRVLLERLHVMSAYVSQNLSLVVQVVAILGSTLVLGFALSRLPSPKVGRSLSWLLVVSTVTCVNWLTRDEAAGFRMLAICGTLLFAMKSVVAVEHRASGRPALSLLGWLGFGALWFGMRPQVFENVPGRPLGGSVELIAKGTKRVVLGAVFLAAAYLLPSRIFGDEQESARVIFGTLLALPGISLVVHFGVFNIAAGLWRFAGANCASLFRAPLAATSLGEFWGRRWNLAFSEMTAIAVFRPLTRCLPDAGSRVLAFVFSGLLHELAISVPVQAGYGLPAAYFALHGLATIVERKLKQSGSRIFEKRWTAWVWTCTWLIVPAPLVFHVPFLKGCVWPLLGIDSET